MLSNVIKLSRFRRKFNLDNVIGTSPIEVGTLLATKVLTSGGDVILEEIKKQLQ